MSSGIFILQCVGKEKLMYEPEEWLIVKISSKDPHYRVFGSWRGGYVNGDSWRMNSGIKSVEKDGDYFIFHGASGSRYRCHKDTYGVNSPHNSTVLLDYKNYHKDKFKIFTSLPDVMDMDWIIK
jgi:hypothetical protein